MKNPNISGIDYQNGEQLGFWNVREYVLFRDGHKCSYCKGKSKDLILNIHHIESRKQEVIPLPISLPCVKLVIRNITKAILI